MRHLLENISDEEKLDDTTTLRDPEVPERIRRRARND
jgi:acetyl-CoA synthetase